MYLLLKYNSGTYSCCKLQNNLLNYYSLLSHLLLYFSIFYFSPFPFLLVLSIFVLFNPFPFYQNSPTPFQGQMS